MRASIIIPAYNAEKTLGTCLRACLSQDYSDLEVFVIDDGSTDGTATSARSVEGVTVHSQTNRGPAAARNAGARLATGDVLLYTDADCIPRADWVSCLVKTFDEGVVAVGGTYDIANPSSRLARVVQAEIAGRHLKLQREVDFLGSFNVAYLRGPFEAVGGFDETYRQASGEDNDLAYRLHELSGKLLYNPNAVVAHYHPERLLLYLRTQARHGFWRMKLYRDHPRRASGDQYAGLADLLAPPMGLGLLFLIPGMLIVGIWSGRESQAAVYGVTMALLYLALHVPKVVQLRNTLSRGDLLYFLLMACLRDIARGLGLLKGLWTFTFSQGSRF